MPPYVKRNGRSMSSKAQRTDGRMSLSFSLYAVGTGNINVGAGAPRRFCFAFQPVIADTKTKSRVFLWNNLEFQKSQTDFKGRARRKHDTRKEIFRARSAVVNTAMIWRLRHNGEASRVIVATGHIVRLPILQ